jgi:hypothetical protein
VFISSMIGRPFWCGRRATPTSDAMIRARAAAGKSSNTFAQEKTEIRFLVPRLRLGT